MASRPLNVQITGDAKGLGKATREADGHLDRLGYSGWIGAEYKPKAGTVEGLGWFRDFAGKASVAA